jgi:hypothetical protein
VQTKSRSAEVDVDLQLSTSVSRSSQPWRFTMRNESGWRVCGAHHLG